MNTDWTKVLGSAVLLAGAIAGKHLNAFPDELCLTLASLVPALWALPTAAKILGIKIAK